jgi:hypothetical protein
MRPFFPERSERLALEGAAVAPSDDPGMVVGASRAPGAKSDPLLEEPSLAPGREPILLSVREKK